MEMKEISTVNMKRNGAESIQWNWKSDYTKVVANFTVDVNPFNGIESGQGGLGVHVELGELESIQWNWKNWYPTTLLC